MISGVRVRCDYIGCESEAIYFICDMGLKFCGRHYCEWSQKNITHHATDKPQIAPCKHEYRTLQISECVKCGKRLEGY